MHPNLSPVHAPALARPHAANNPAREEHVSEGPDVDFQQTVLKRPTKKKKASSAS